MWFKYAYTTIVLTMNLFTRVTTVLLWWSSKIFESTLSWFWSRVETVNMTAYLRVYASCETVCIADKERVLKRIYVY